MAWSIINKDVPGKVPVFRTFICDTVDDINTLPNGVAPGSEAFCAENGNVYVLGVNKVWVEKKSEGGGSGGNPNYVETITGTLGNPWGNIDLQGLYDELVAGDASATITFLRGTTERTRMTLFFEPDTDVAAGDNAFYTEGVYLTGSNMNVYSLYWYTGELEEANYTSGASAKAIDFSDNAEMLAKVTTLTIVHHPLPE